MLATTITIALIVLSVGVSVYSNQTSTGQSIADTVVRVACVGDSITSSFGYPERLGVLLGDNYTVGNFGVGATTVSLHSRNPYLYQPKFQLAKAFQPDIVIIMLGANDAHPDNHKYNATFVEDYLELIRAFQALSSNPQVWMVLPPPIFANGTGLSTEHLAMQVVPMISQAAEEANVPVIDVYSALLNRSDYFLDGVHPNYNGAQAIASIICEAITSE